jgi:hypothetical protein
MDEGNRQRHVQSSKKASKDRGAIDRRVRACAAFPELSESGSASSPGGRGFWCTWVGTGPRRVSFHASGYVWFGLRTMADRSTL